MTRPLLVQQQTETRLREAAAAQALTQRVQPAFETGMGHGGAAAQGQVELAAAQPELNPQSAELARAQAELGAPGALLAVRLLPAAFRAGLALSNFLSRGLDHQGHEETGPDIAFPTQDRRGQHLQLTLQDVLQGLDQLAAPRLPWQWGIELPLQRHAVPLSASSSRLGSFSRRRRGSRVARQGRRRG